MTEEGGEAERARAALENAATHTTHTRSGLSTWQFIMFFFVWIFHILDGFATNFEPNASYTLIRIIIYTIAAISVMSLFEKKEEPFIIAGIEILLVPWLLHFAKIYSATYAFEESFGVLVFLWAFTSLFSIVLAANYARPKSIPRFLYKVWLWVLVIPVGLIFLFSFIGDILPNMPFADQFNPNNLNVMSYSKAAIENTKERAYDSVIYPFVDVFTVRIPRALENSINYATGGYYTGMVEDQQGEPVGIYIEQLRFANDRHFTEEPIYLWADISGKSFENIVDVTASCQTRDGIQGKTNEGSENEYYKQFSIYQEGFEVVQCKFEDLQEGTHTIYFEANFDFETWAYVTYTFTDQKTILNYLSQGKDVARELDVSRVLRPVYTPGPVSIGMASNIPQPIGVATGENVEQPIKTVLGVTLANIWTEGELTSVREFTVLVPEIFELNNCDVPSDSIEVQNKPFCEDETSDKCAKGMDGYFFKNIGVPRTFRSITCDLNLKEDYDVNDLIKVGEQKVQHTFVVKADYNYNLFERATIGVIDIGRREQYR